MDGVLGEIKGEICVPSHGVAHGQWQGNLFTGLIQAKDAHRLK